MNKYPLISKLNLYVLDKGDIEYVHAYDLEQLLEKATVVYGQGENTSTEWSTSKFGIDTHKALLIAIEPLEQKKVTITRDDLHNAYCKMFKSGLIDRSLSTHNLQHKDFELLAKELGL